MKLYVKIGSWRTFIHECSIVFELLLCLLCYSGWLGMLFKTCMVNEVIIIKQVKTCWRDKNKICGRDE